ncbi:MAG TPA: N-acetyl-gamma-glutamyl-phosphate reductase [Polyangiaceae bacterium]
MPETCRVGIFGATGYTGIELLRLVHSHPRLTLSLIASGESAGRRLGDVVPPTEGIAELGDRVLSSFDPEQVPRFASQMDVAFTALPHTASANIGKALLEAGVRVVDLSADFRLKDPHVYEKAYGPHPAPELLSKAVYGLPELYRSELKDARLIAAPGCYPTSAILPLAPLLAKRLIAPESIIIDSKSGVSGAGRAMKRSSQFCEVAEGVRPYQVAGQHRHIPEIEQELSRQATRPVTVVFTPHLVPMSRGILTVAYAKLAAETKVEELRRVALEMYAQGLVTVLEAGRVPDTLWVRGSARAHVAYALDERAGMVLGMCALDNLTRGAAAQAVQALNAAMGWPDALGLPEMGLFP